MGWGAHSGDADSGGKWSIQERGIHINEKELLAVLKGLGVICSSHSNVTLQIKSDNMTTVSYKNKQGCCKSLVFNEIARSIWFWAQNRSIFLVSCHIPGMKFRLSTENAQLET